MEQVVNIQAKSKYVSNYSVFGLYNVTLDRDDEKYIKNEVQSANSKKKHSAYTVEQSNLRSVGRHKQNSMVETGIT